MNLTKVIRSHGYTVRQVESELGYKDGTIRNLFSRANTHENFNVSISLVKKIADCIGCSQAEFFVEEPITHNGTPIADAATLVVNKSSTQQAGQPKLIIKEVMRKKNVSVRQLSNALHMSYTGTCTMVNKKNLNTKNLYMIADALDAKITDLFGYK